LLRDLYILFGIIYIGYEELNAKDAKFTKKMHPRHNGLTVSSAADHVIQYGMDAKLLRNIPECC
jgi:hypothetical protein